MTTRAEPEDHLWSADHSLRNADVVYYGLFIAQQRLDYVDSALPVRRCDFANSQSITFHLYSHISAARLVSDETFTVSFKYNQQDATLCNILYCCPRCTCFRRFLRPSSGAQKLYTQHLVYVKLACCYR